MNGLGLSGQLPLSQDVWQPLSTLTNLDLGNNNISGYLPADIALLTNLKTLNLANNQLNGARPD